MDYSYPPHDQVFAMALCKDDDVVPYVCLWSSDFKGPGVGHRAQIQPPYHGPGPEIHSEQQGLPAVPELQLQVCNSLTLVIGPKLPQYVF